MRIAKPIDWEQAAFESVEVSPEVAMLLPTRVASEFRERAGVQARAMTVEDHRFNENLRSNADSHAANNKRERDAKRLHELRLLRWATPRPGWHRVLPQLADIAKELADPTWVERSPDRDVNQRRRRTLERLVELGPDRRVAVPPDWRAAVDDLEVALPHFREAIRTLRNSLALGDATGTPPRIPPLLLLGPPGLGKTYFSHRVAEMFGSTHTSIQFDQPNAGTGLWGSDKHWGNTESGLLFNSICLGEFANPLILLDEMDKAAIGSGRRELDPLAQLHGALERETAQRLLDASMEVTFDASLTVYVGTANSLQGMGAPLVSRMEICVIEPPDKWAAIDLARSIAASVLRSLNLTGSVKFDHRALCRLAHLSPRRMTRSTEQAVAAAVAAGRSRICEDDLWNEMTPGRSSFLH